MMRAETNNVMDFHDADRYSSVAALELIKAKCVIEQFIYSCSHSLRAPLKSIAGLVYLLKNSDDSKNEEQQYFFRAIEKTTGKMETLLDELEQFLSNSRQKIATEPIKIESVINRCLDEVHESICERKLNVIVSVLQPGLFYTDENRVTMVLSQLISNAIQFSDASKSNRRLLIRVKVSQESCQLRMVDNGVGISAQVLPKIFDLFFRGSVQSAGAGVGLYIVQDALTALGGTVTVRSNEGKGAFFQVTIPNLPL